jgi:hypothetical protein
MKTAVLFLALFAMPLQGQKPSTVPSIDQGRYQLLAVPLDDPYPASIGSSNARKSASQQLFLFDSQTGRVWHYRPESFTGTLSDFAKSSSGAAFAPEAFVPIPIWSPGEKDKVLP